MKKRRKFAILLAATLIVSGCSATSEMLDAQSSTQPASASSTISASDMFTDRDMEMDYDAQACAEIQLSGDSAASTSNSVQISEGTVTITEEGVYRLSGTLEEGMIVVNAPDGAKVQLVLDGVQIHSATSAAIYVLEADKVFITTASESENTMENGGEYVDIDENNIDAVIFSKSDLTLNGTGMLTITAAAGHGIVSKDDLVLTGGNYHITAASHGLSGKDSVRIADGSYVISSGKDGIHAENADDVSLGFLYVAGGNFDIDAQGDGMSASAELQIAGGEFDIFTGEGSASVTMKTDSMNFGPQNDTQTQTETDSVSQKGIKGEGTFTILAGRFTIDSADDAFHAGGDLQISGGTFDLKSGDDAIHSDAAVQIGDGDFVISYCYEGIEGYSVTIDAGTFEINSEDDGLNAAGGADSSGFGGDRPGQDRFASDSDCFIVINGGSLNIVSKGDCIDSNGALTINGGDLNLTCNGNGDTALDCDGEYVHNGGNVVTNDGSEANPGQMGGGMGRPGGMGRGGGKP